MQNLYRDNTANFPRLTTDVFFTDYNNTYKFNDYIDMLARFVENKQSMRSDLWERFVKQFEEHSDTDNGWRGEYWGKMMRGACFLYSYTKNQRVLEILKKSVYNIIEVQKRCGRLSTYPIDKELVGWDIWSRKYVMLGMEYFLEISDEEELNDEIIKSLKYQADDLIEKIGKEEEGKKPICLASYNYRGLNSSSVLEPIVRLYSITKEKKYFDFAEYIVSCGATACENLFELAYQNNFYPYQYPITKAYEMISCFEGLLEFYRVTKIEKYKIAVINFANRILESDFTIVGSCGCTHEFFDHSAVRQANTTNGRSMQETCVTVTLMKFFYQVLLLTGNSKFADAIEKSFYNAYLGSINIDENYGRNYDETDGVRFNEPLPFDSYSPLTAGVRGNGVGGFKVLSDGHYYGCCACIGAAGFGVFAKSALMVHKNGLCLNYYSNGMIKSKTPNGNDILFKIDTKYPLTGDIIIKISLEKKEEFSLFFRNPCWSKATKAFLNGKKIEITDGYVEVKNSWKDGDILEIKLDMRTEAIYPISYGTDILMNKVCWELDYTVPNFDKEDPIAKNHIALRRGPVILAQENRLGYSVDEPVEVLVNADGYVDIVETENLIAPFVNQEEVLVPLKNGNFMRLTDYASVGKTLDDNSKMAAWILTK